MSSDLARWYHSMTFTYADEWDDENKKHGTINTWDDWHLVPTSRPVFKQGTVKTNYVNLPGGNGDLDLSEVVAGRPTYNPREGTIEFIVMNGYHSNWANKHSQISNWLHGRKLRVVLDDDSFFFYEGRFSVNDWKSNSNGTWSNITLNYHLDPFKYTVPTSFEKWFWDPFNFYTGVIVPDFKDIRFQGTYEHTFIMNDLEAIPMIYVPTRPDKSSLIITINDVEIPFSDEYIQKCVDENSKTMIRDSRFLFVSGENKIKVVCNKENQDVVISIYFRGRSL